MKGTFSDVQGSAVQGDRTEAEPRKRRLRGSVIVCDDFNGSIAGRSGSFDPDDTGCRIDERDGELFYVNMYEAVPLKDKFKDLFNYRSETD